MADLTRHPDVVDLAEYAEGLLDPTHRAAVEDHVRGCLDCSRVLSDLTELPTAMAQAPMPPMPTDVAERLDRAIATESSARASGWSGAAAMVTPLRPRRRWLAPVVAAAAVVGAIAIAVPILDNSGIDGNEDSASEDTSQRDLDHGGQDLTGDAPAPESDAIPLPALSSDHFGRDVLASFYHGSTALRLSKEFATMSEPGVDVYRDSVETIPGLCSSDGSTTVPDGQVDDVTYDGADAQLLRLEVDRTVEAIAFRCGADGPDVLDAVTLRPRS